MCGSQMSLAIILFCPFESDFRGWNSFTWKRAATFLTKCDGGDVSDAITEGEPTDEIILTIRSSLASFSTPEQMRLPERSRSA
jgi:hypothetical protein